MPKIERPFDSPGPQPNGMQATEEGLWIIDQQTDEVHLVSYQGTVKKTLETGSDRGSGITHTGTTFGWRLPIVVKSCQLIQKREKHLHLMKPPVQDKQVHTV